MHPVTGGSPRPPGLPALRAAAADCRARDLWKRGTQTVFGEGTRNAGIVLVGEQPGDKEDVAGKPFVGPAGQLLDRALEEAGIDRSRAYVTNVVKHFKWTGKGKRRIAPTVLATAHPSSVLRVPDDDARRRAYADLVADLEVAARLLRGGLARAPRRSG